MPSSAGYRDDLAFIHDRGFSSFSLNAVPGLLGIFRKYGISDKHIVELGCGSGRMAHALIRRGFTVTGFDASPSMIALARRNAPHGMFRVGSFWNCAIPRAGAVLSVGEALNYRFARPVSTRRFRSLFAKVHAALLPSGIFVFDILCERKSGEVVKTRSFTEGNGWLVAVDKSDGPHSVVRRITTFRRVGRSYRRSFELHSVRRYNLQEITAVLEEVGFHVVIRPGYGKAKLGHDHVVIVAKSGLHSHPPQKAPVR